MSIVKTRSAGANDAPEHVGSHSISGVSSCTAARQDHAHRISPPRAGKVQQQDERRHGAAVAAAGEPLQQDSSPRRSAITATDLPAARARIAGRLLAVPAGVRRDQAAQQGAPDAADFARPGRRRSDSLFDVHVKRSTNTSGAAERRGSSTTTSPIEDNRELAVPRPTFSGKAAPGYWAAKQIIKLICSVARVERDPRAGVMKIVFLPDLCRPPNLIVPAADLSEQISGRLGSPGTGNYGNSR
jgi:hypothetical protein